MRVLIVTSEAPPVTSGISRCVDRLSTGLQGRGHRVDVLSSNEIPRLNLGEFRISSLATRWPGISARLPDYDVVNLHGPVPTMSDVFLLMSRRRPAAAPPIVYTHHSAIEIRGVERASSAYTAVHRRLASRADLTITTSRHYADVHTVPGGPPVQVLPWGVDPAPPAGPPPARRGAGPLRVLFVGQMRSYKGVEWLLRAVEGLSGVELTLVGSGPHLADYERMAAWADNVTFLGRVGDRELQEAYASHHVVVLPSVTRAEAFGLVVLEGMAAGCVPVVSDLPGVRDLVGDTGLVVPPRDAAALRRALRTLAAAGDRLVDLQDAARRRAATFTWESCVAGYEGAFLTALGRRGRRPAAVGRLHPVAPPAAERSSVA